MREGDKREGERRSYDACKANSQNGNDVRHGRRKIHGISSYSESAVIVSKKDRYVVESSLILYIYEQQIVDLPATCRR
jgi:hypothetical protein